MIPALKPERILSRCLFEVTDVPDKTDICRELYRLAGTLSPFLTSHHHLQHHHHASSSSATNNSSTKKLLDDDFVLSQLFIWRTDLLSSASSTLVLEIRDSRMAALFCNILEDKRVIRLASGGGAQLTWYIGGGSTNSGSSSCASGTAADNASSIAAAFGQQQQQSGGGGDETDIEKVAVPLTDATTRAEEELRMNVDAEMWGQALERRNDIDKWLDLYAPVAAGGGSVSTTSVDRVVQALIRATAAMVQKVAPSAQHQDPFRNALFVGAFDNQQDGRTGLLTSLLPYLHEVVQPSARQVSMMITHPSKNVYVRALALLYVRYRCSPENIAIFFSNAPPPQNVVVASGGERVPTVRDAIAPSVFSMLGKPFDKFASSVLLDANALLQTSDGGTTTMREFSRALLLEDEVLEMWLPTYSAFAVRSLRQFIDDVTLAADFEQQQQQARFGQAATTRTLPHRRDRDQAGAVGDDAGGGGPSRPPQGSGQDQQISSSSTLLPGVKSITQFVALMQEQVRHNEEEQRAKKEREAEEEARLRRQFAATGTEGDHAQRKEIFARQATSLRDRRRREVLERLRSATVVQQQQQQQDGNTAGTGRRKNAAAAGDFHGGSPGHYGSSGDGIDSSSSSAESAVPVQLVQRSLSFFGSFPPPYAVLPPMSSSTSVLGNAVRATSNPIAALCSTTTVGTDDVFVCF